MLYLYLLTPKDGLQEYGWSYSDTYSNAVVVAHSVEEARNIHPDGTSGFWNSATWPLSDDVVVTLLGIADESFQETCIIISNFQSG